MLDNYIKQLEILRKELLFLVLPALLLTISLYLLKNEALPLYTKIQNMEESQQNRRKAIAKKEILMKEITQLLNTSLVTVSSPQKERISKNSAMALLFAKAKEASITINRSTPGSTDDNFTISLDFLCTFREVISYITLLNNEKETLTIDALSLHSDRESLRCSMKILFFNCGEKSE